MPDDHFHDKVVVVTGASAGVGRAVARAFADRGAHLGLLARGEGGLAGAKRDVLDRGGRAVSVPTDVADADAVEAAAQQIEDELGPIDVWVNNAMATVFAPVSEITPDEFRRVTEVTYLGSVYGTMCALQRMKPRDRGSIVQVGSALAYRGIPLQSAYCGAKHGVQGFLESLHTELLHEKSNVQLSIVHMPALNTPQFRWSRSRMQRKAQPVPPIFQPEVAADAVVWAAAHERREMYVGMPTVTAIWGDKVAPWYAARYLARNGYEAQQTDEPEDPNRPDNLYEPVPGDFGAHGVFDHRARDHSPQLWMTKRREAFGVGAAALAAGVLGWLLAR